MEINTSHCGSSNNGKQVDSVAIEMKIYLKNRFIDVSGVGEKVKISQHENF